MKKKSKSLLFLIVFFILSKNTHAQTPDTVIINVGDQGKIIIQVKDASKIDEWKKFDLNQVIAHLEDYLQQKKVILKNDTTFLLTQGDYKKSQFVMVKVRTTDKDTTATDYSSQDNSDLATFGKEKKQERIQILTGFKNKSETIECEFFVHLGFNNYLRDFKFPDNSYQGRLSTTGSRYVAVNFMAKSPINKNRTFYTMYGLELSWYNFMYADPNGPFINSLNQLDKGKLTAYYLNLPVILMYDQGKKRFRIGLGPYIGYKLGAYMKTVNVDGAKIRYRDRNDDFGLTDWHAGLRLQVGVRRLNLFFNYNITNLYNRSPNDTNYYTPFSFGIIL